MPPDGYACPKCGDRVRQTDLPPEFSDFTVSDRSVTHLPQLELLLDNTRSLYNVGSIFRTADGVGIEMIHLCGITGTPDHPKFEKTALGSHIKWRYYLNGVDAAKALKAQGHQLWALEDGPNAVNLFELKSMPQDQKIVLVLGNEVVGVDPEILALCDQTLVIPMVGEKRSLNVTIACGTATYYLMHALRPS